MEDFTLKIENMDNEMTQWLKALTTKHDYPWLTPGTYMVEEESQLLQLSSLPLTPVVLCVHTHIHIQTLPHIIHISTSHIHTYYMADTLNKLRKKSDEESIQMELNV